MKLAEVARMKGCAAKTVQRAVARGDLRRDEYGEVTIRDAQRWKLKSRGRQRGKASNKRRGSVQFAVNDTERQEIGTLLREGEVTAEAVRRVVLNVARGRPIEKPIEP